MPWVMLATRLNATARLMPPVSHNTSLLQAISNLISQPGAPPHARAKPGAVRGSAVERIEPQMPAKGAPNPKAVRGSYLDILV